MKRLLPLLILLCTTTVFADSRAKEILKQARRAIGGEEQLQKIQGLHINGQYRRMFGERQMGGDREIKILLPNKYLVEDAMNAGGLSTGGGDGAAPPSLPGASTKKYRFELYAQAFNLLNHANLGVFNGVQTSPFFAQATSAQPPRRMELGLRFNF